MSAEDHPFQSYRSYVTAVLTFMPIGNAPRLKNNKFTAAGHQTFAEIFALLRTACSQADVHLYVNNQFEPIEDQTVVDVARCCGKRPPTAPDDPHALALNVHYSIGRAYV